MSRLLLPAVVLTALAAPPASRADAFDHYTNSVLAKVPGAEGVKELKQLPAALITDNSRVLKDATAALVVVRTNGDRWAKLLVQAARQKVGDDRSLRIVLVERFVTYKEGTERAIHVGGSNVTLFPGFRFSLDLGQVVPEELGGDLRLVVDGDKVHLETLKDARLYLLTKPLPDAVPKKADKVVVGDTFEPRYFNGTYKLYDDGRRSGTLTLKVAEGGEVTGTYTSDKDGRDYEVKGKVGSPPHAIQFAVQFPQAEQTFQGWLFTGNAKVLTGSSRLANREQGFYAVRVEEE